MKTIRKINQHCEHFLAGAITEEELRRALILIIDDDTTSLFDLARRIVHGK